MYDHIGLRVENLDATQRERVRALAAATDNIGLFFGEDVFIALGAVLLIQSFYAQNGIALEPIAIAAFVIHVLRVALFQRSLRRSKQDAAHAED